MGNVSTAFSVDDLKQTGLNRFMYGFSIDYGGIDADDILDIHKYLMKKTRFKIMFGFIKKMFIGLSGTFMTISFGESLASNTKRCIKCVSLSNRPCEATPTLVDINSNKTLFIYCQCL